jgi:hypothetical protein
MGLKEMAATIDAGVEQAQQHLQNHMEETHANLQKDSRAERARRRASREPSQEGSVASDDVEKDKTQRVAAWASSLDSSQLDEIPEEDDAAAARSTPDDASQKDTDPSSFPSGMFDHSYNYERGLRKPNITIRKPQESFLQDKWKATRQVVQESRQSSSQVLASSVDWFRRLGQAGGRAMHSLPESRIIVTGMSLLVVTLLTAAASLLFCHAYTHYVCDPYSTSPVGLTLQKYCGGCHRHPGASLNLSAADEHDLSKLSAALRNINNEMRAIESRLSDKLESQYATVDKDIYALKREHSELSSQLPRLKGGASSSSAHDVASPVIAKINFFAPNNGAAVVPRLTSPTREKPLPLPQRVLLRMFGSAVYQTKPAEAALTPWQDVGDCWCASAVPSEQDSMRLGVKVNELIYPTEVVLENYPSSGSLFPGSTPRKIEVWADFDHLPEWRRLDIRLMQGDSPFGPSWALIGQMEYDASADASHVQAFALDVNQQDLSYAAQNFVVRVVSNYGSDYTCLYRVRMHGVSAMPESEKTTREQ